MTKIKSNFAAKNNTVPHNSYVRNYTDRYIDDNDCSMLYSPLTTVGVEGMIDGAKSLNSDTRTNRTFCCKNNCQGSYLWSGLFC